MAFSWCQTAPVESLAFLLLNIALRREHTGHHFRQTLAHETGAAGKALHHLAGLSVLLEQAVDLLHAGAATLRDAPAASPVDQHVIVALLGRHRIDDRDNARNL